MSEPSIRGLFPQNKQETVSSQRYTLKTEFEGLGLLSLGKCLPLTLTTGGRGDWAEVWGFLGLTLMPLPLRG